MNFVKARACIETRVSGNEILRQVERAGRVCYKSEDKIAGDSSRRFVRGLIEKGHESVLEHVNITVRFVCDRGVSHEIVRHRIASHTQESTRYCNYSQDKFNNELNIIEPCFWKDSHEHVEKVSIWFETITFIEKQYMKLMELGAKPEEARSILPNALKTELVMTANLREWRHFFKLRTSKAAHPQMREVAIPLLEDFKRLIPIIFDDIEVIRDGQRPRVGANVREDKPQVHSEDNGAKSAPKEKK